MEKSSFFDAEKLADGSFDRVYSSEDIAEYFSSFVGNGVYANPATSLQVVAHSTSNMIMVKAGKAWINGYFYQLTEDLELPITTGNPSQPRVDTVVVRWDFLKRNIELVVVAGTPSNAPQPKAPVRTSTKYELVLANILVKPGAMVITNAEITDKRFDAKACGIVKGVIEQVDTTQLFKQYDTEFSTWFDNLKAVLDGNVAANLQKEIQANKAEINLLKQNSDNKAEIINAIYPVGSIYLSTNGANPSTFLGGSWKQITSGVLACAGSSGYAAVGQAGGSNTITVAQLPSHTHTGTTASAGTHNHKTAWDVDIAGGSSHYGPHLAGDDGKQKKNVYTGKSGAHTHTFTTNATGSGQAHVPYHFSVNVWERIG